MKTPISLDRWLSAQKGEKIYHISEGIEESFQHYRLSYSYYFRYLGIDPDLQGKSVIEVGPGRISSLLFCKNFSKSYVVEPTDYDGIDHLYLNSNIEILKQRAEECEMPKVDEVWLFNLMQHVQDPDKLIDSCKKAAKVIRFFEPIDLPTNNEHPFSFSREDFVGYFGDCVKNYVSIGEPNFHSANCVYGVFKTLA